MAGAASHERIEARSAQRNGFRSRTLSTTAWDLELRMPKLRTGSFFPSLLRPGLLRPDGLLWRAHIQHTLRLPSTRQPPRQPTAQTSTAAPPTTTTPP